MVIQHCRINTLPTCWTVWQPYCKEVNPKLDSRKSFRKKIRRARTATNVGGGAGARPTGLTHPMHPGLGVLIYSHQFQVRWSQRAQVAGRSAGRRRAVTATTPAKGTAPCPYLMQALDTKTNPKKRTPPSLTTCSSKIQTLSVISATSPFVWRQSLYNKSSSLPNPTWYF